MPSRAQSDRLFKKDGIKQCEHIRAPCHNRANIGGKSFCPYLRCVYRFDSDFLSDVKHKRILNSNSIV